MLLLCNSKRVNASQQNTEERHTPSLCHSAQQQLYVWCSERFQNTFEMRTNQTNARVVLDLKLLVSVKIAFMFTDELCILDVAEMTRLLLHGVTHQQRPGSAECVLLCAVTLCRKPTVPSKFEKDLHSSASTHFHIDEKFSGYIEHTGEHGAWIYALPAYIHSHQPLPTSHTHTQCRWMGDAGGMQLDEWSRLTAHCTVLTAVYTGKSSYTQNGKQEEAMYANS